MTFGIDVSKYQSGLDWNKIKKSGVSFVIIRIGYRGYGAAGNLVKDPMFEEHFTNARNAGLKVGVYFFTQAVNEAEAQEEAEACNWALNGRMLDYPIFYDTEASSRCALFSFLGISTSHLTYISPRPRPFRYWMPLPRRRKVVPLWVPSGTVYSTLPSMEGTVTLSPRTAWL